MNRLRDSFNVFFWLDAERAAQRGGCLICAILERATLRYLDGFLYENVLDASLRDKLIASQGFCNAHGHALLRVAQETGGASGVATVYENLTAVARKQIQSALASLARPSEEIRRWARRQKIGERAARALKAKQRCPLCEHAIFGERSGIEELVRHLGDVEEGERMRELYQQSAGLCLPHLRRALRAASDPAVASFLLQTQLEKLETLHAELAEFCRKQDYRFKNEPMSEGEKTAWLRVLEAFIGKQQIPHEDDDPPPIGARE